jgi:hypothetical protein
MSRNSSDPYVADKCQVACAIFALRQELKSFMARSNQQEPEKPSAELTTEEILRWRVGRAQLLAEEAKALQTKIDMISRYFPDAHHYAFVQIPLDKPLDLKAVLGLVGAKSEDVINWNHRRIAQLQREDIQGA